MIGVFNEPLDSIVSAKRPYASVDDLKKVKGLKIVNAGTLWFGSTAEVPFIESLGLDAKIITGYKGGSEMALAAGKGEIDIVPLADRNGLDSVNKGFVKAPVVVMGRRRVDVFKDSPAFTRGDEFHPGAKGNSLKRRTRASYILRVGAAPPGVPEDRVKFMQDSFAKIVAMEGFKEQSKLDVSPGANAIVGRRAKYIC